MALEWTPALSVGDAEIDAQHQELFRRADRLLSALRAGDRAEVGPTVAFLSSYAATHFAMEEELMRSARYPLREEHERQHEGFRAEFGALVADFDRKGATPLVAMTVHNWLAGWLKKHLGETDRALVQFLEQRPR